MAELRVRKVKDFSAELKVPGDKSISHRALMFSALSNGPCEITGFLASEDCIATRNALAAMGVEIEELGSGGTHIRVHGCHGEFKKPERAIDCGNSGTSRTIRRSRHIGTAVRPVPRYNRRRCPRAPLRARAS